MLRSKKEISSIRVIQLSNHKGLVGLGKIDRMPCKRLREEEGVGLRKCSPVI